MPLSPFTDKKISPGKISDWPNCPWSGGGKADRELDPRILLLFEFWKILAKWNL